MDLAAVACRVKGGATTMRVVKPHVTHHFACDCREARFEAMEAALRQLNQIQPDIIPGRNDEFIRARWVFDIVEKVLKELET